MEILLLGTDTLHRRFIINSLLDEGIKLNTCIFQNQSHSPSFKVRAPWYKIEKLELTKKFKKKTRIDLRRVKKIIKIKNLSSIDVDTKEEIIKANFIIVSGADWIKGELLNKIRHKSLNVHMGIVQKYRGLDSNLWAWYHNDFKNMGVTLHKLDYSLDTGSIFKSQNFKILENTKIWHLRYLESNLAVKLLKRALNLFALKKLKLKKQKSYGKYYSFMPSVIKERLNQKITKI